MPRRISKFATDYHIGRGHPRTKIFPKEAFRMSINQKKELSARKERIAKCAKKPSGGATYDAYLEKVAIAEYDLSRYEFVIEYYKSPTHPHTRPRPFFLVRM